MEDFIGQVFGNLTIFNSYIKKDGCGSNRIYCDCECLCGNKRYGVWLENLKHGKTKSCGCSKKEENRFEFTGNGIVVGYDKKGNSFIFDEIYIDRVKDNCWNVGSDGYVSSLNRKRKRIYLHNVIMEKSEIRKIDHINRNPPDNRKANLRETNGTLNNFNRDILKTNNSGIVGVSKTSDGRYWRASIKISGETVTVVKKYYRDAVRERLIMENYFLGELSPQKFLFEEFGIILNKNPKITPH